MKTINLGIFAHIDAGKTTLTEQILHIAGILPSVGTIEEGTTESDTLIVEIERGISVLSSLMQFECKNFDQPFRINLLDTPGHLDFRTQVESVLDSIDLAVVLIDGSRGVESQTIMLHEALSEKNIPEIFFINKLDRAEDFLPESLVSLEELLKKTPPIVFIEGSYNYIWIQPDKFSERTHLELIEWNEELVGEYLSNPNKLYEISRLGLLTGLEKSKLTPVFGGSAYFGQGVRELLDFIGLLNFPIPVPVTGAEIILSKRINHSELGHLTLARTLRDFSCGDMLGCQGQNIPITQAYHLLGDKAISINKIQAGDIFASPDLNNLKSIAPVYDSPFVAIIEAEQSQDRIEIWNALSELSWEDPSYILKEDSSTGSYQLYGRGELHLEIAISRFRELCLKNFAVGELQVARYERCKTMVKKLALEHTAFESKNSSGKLVAILEDTAGFSKHIAFEVSLSEKIHNAISTGFFEALSQGNYHLEVLGAQLTIVSYEPPEAGTEFTPSLLKVALLSGVRQALQDQTELIGPVSDLEVFVDDTYVGNVLSLLQKRSAHIIDIRKRFSDKSQILARVGTENLLGFSGALRNMTKGTGISFQRNTFSPENYNVLNERKAR
ncbi:GTP-binding protein [Leptospira sp. GIMC2001]|uniref:GTP-binding protein n=1 Tax=Leptospira sp. GIMC2001 TaxID=1513297 RepID=UPI00234B32A9|nr:GTP-binding protein [Leptospira sp. GIMC2001]WCL51077.1 GTP-binding protein [Leptospira sp. GIMC2001]